MTDEKTDALFLQYKQTGDVKIRNQIAEKYLYIADILAKKFVGRGVEYDDLKQVASYALLRGIERFDPDLGMQFTTYITPTITGEIKNYFRDKSRVMKLPRRLSELNGQIRAFTAKYEAEYGAKPSVKTIAEALKTSEEEIVRTLEVAGTVSLDGMTASGEDGEDVSLYSVVADKNDEYEAFETKEMLRTAMKDFSAVEKALIKYRYVDELSQNETAKRMGVSQMYVSRMERKLLERLRANLNRED